MSLCPAALLPYQMKLHAHANAHAQHLRKKMEEIGSRSPAAS